MTWSLLIRDSTTGALGAVVASRFFAVGALTIAVEGGLAALATQALVNPMYRPRALARLRAGESPTVVLAALTGDDAGAAHRQCHILDASGRIAQHTGAGCVAWAGAVCGTDISVAGNMLAGPEVIARTRDAFAAASGSLPERMLAAMRAGEAAGGDRRGRQSAALLLATADPYPDLDLRADDHPDPLAELLRLYRVSLERFAVFRRFLPGANHPGVSDREVIEAALAREARPPGR